ncbi:hypothetical protein SD70_22865 [Gordoniibacillus kamchatkensis]|uniref:DNA-binding response regulator n=1 Tax=Gordoniibacillus kamchatkensis TaxID=1590651 RepID=A0ABR5AD96_9BACL|nr:response regulator [Paenibacillus sp. VKM B-2647]KIL38987.1 hypothetical protein SD70_22865 [Paenibacillus sp. VKM B-2647]
MYSLLIAEDEGWMRDVLAAAAYWEQCGITRIFEASNGEEAYRIVQANKVDFILSDIRMPVMDGLELLAKAKERSPDIEIVMLTGFDDFDYVRSAMRLGAYDYLLKPASDDELVQLFLKLSRHKNAKQAEQYRIAMEQSAWKQSKQLLQEQFLASWFSGRKTDYGWFQQKCKELDVAWLPHRYVVFLFEADQLHVLQNHFGQRDMELLQYGIRNIAEEYLKERGLQFHIFTVDERMAVWCEAGADPAETEALLGGIRQSAKRFIKITVSVGISKQHSAETEAFQAYIEALNSLKMKLYLGNDQTYFFDELQFEGDRQLFHRELQQKLHNCVVAGNEEELHAILSALFDEIRRKKIAVQPLDQMLQLMMQMVSESASFDGADMPLGHSEDEWMGKVRAMDTIDEIEAYVTSSFQHAARQAAEKRKQRKSKLITDILRFLEEHYSEDISLQTLAEQFYVNSSYLSRLFKEEAGQIYTKYMMQLRIEKAKHLLKSTHKKVYEVSEEVGYTDVKYFNKIFKDMTGLTPAEYRDL